MMNLKQGRILYTIDELDEKVRKFAISNVMLSMKLSYKRQIQRAKSEDLHFKINSKLIRRLIGVKQTINNLNTEQGFIIVKSNVCWFTEKGVYITYCLEDKVEGRIEPVWN